jgi:mannose-6-phosphate isomerase-like protein (cupin superfamily)
MHEINQNTIQNTINQSKYLEIGNRPWGQYFVMETADKFKVKKLVIKPNQRLSLQSHKYRSEHWIVVSGVANLEVQIGNNKSNWVKDYKPNEYCFIPLGARHRICNFGIEDLVIIEVQCGDYTGEDDIVRYQDDYGRN